MGVSYWGASPLCRISVFLRGVLYERILGTDTRRGKRGEVTTRGEEACDCVVKRTTGRRMLGGQPIVVRRIHVRSCEATNRNGIRWPAARGLLSLEESHTLSFRSRAMTDQDSVTSPFSITVTALCNAVVGQM